MKLDPGGAPELGRVVAVRHALVRNGQLTKVRVPVARTPRRVGDGRRRRSRRRRTRGCSRRSRPSASGAAGADAAARARRVSSRAVRIGVAKEIKADEYRVALTPAGALELIKRGHEVTVETGAGVGSCVRRRGVRARRRPHRLRRRGLGSERAAAEGEGAGGGGVRAAARRADALHLPPHRRRRAAHAGARRLGRHGRRLRDRGDRARRAAAARADVGGGGPPFGAGGRVLPREAVRRAGAAARRGAGRRAGQGS